MSDVGQLRSRKFLIGCPYSLQDLNLIITENARIIWGNGDVFGYLT